MVLVVVCQPWQQDSKAEDQEEQGCDADTLGRKLPGLGCVWQKSKMDFCQHSSFWVWEKTQRCLMPDVLARQSEPQGQAQLALWQAQKAEGHLRAQVPKVELRFQRKVQLAPWKAQTKEAHLQL